MSTRHRTILFTDIKGFTARVSESNRDDLRLLRDRHANLLLPVFRHFSGRVVKKIGDAFLVVFDSSTNAVLCGVTVQEVLRQHNASVEAAERIDIRVAINAGDVEIADGDVLGEPVNIAARLEEVAEPGEVFFTEAVYLSMNRREAPAAIVGEHTFKGIPYPVRVYRVLQPEDSPLRRRVSAGVRLTPRGPVITGFAAPPEDAPRRGRLWMVAGVVVVLAGLAAWSLWPTPGDRALRQAKATTDVTEALDIATVGLAAEPDHADLRAFALKRARERMAELRATNAAEALDWVRLQIERRPFLDPLREAVPELEAERAAESESPLQEALAVAKKYDGSAAVAHAAAERMRRRGEVNALTLYGIAYERGRKPDRVVFDWVCELYGKRHVGHVMGGERLMRGWFPDEFDAWTKEHLVTTENPRLFDNLVSLGRRQSWFDSYYHELSRCLGSSVTKSQYQESLDIVLAEKDPARRKQAIALHERVIAARRPGFVKDRCRDALERLRSE